MTEASDMSTHKDTQNIRTTTVLRLYRKPASESTQSALWEVHIAICHLA